MSFVFREGVQVVVVKNTFLEVVDGASEISGSCRRHRSLPPMVRYGSVMEYFQEIVGAGHSQLEVLSAIWKEQLRLQTYKLVDHAELRTSGSDSGMDEVGSSPSRCSVGGRRQMHCLHGPRGATMLLKVARARRKSQRTSVTTTSAGCGRSSGRAQGKISARP